MYCVLILNILYIKHLYYIFFFSPNGMGLLKTRIMSFIILPFTIIEDPETWQLILKKVTYYLLK